MFEHALLHILVCIKCNLAFLTHIRRVNRNQVWRVTRFCWAWTLASIVMHRPNMFIGAVTTTEDFLALRALVRQNVPVIWGEHFMFLLLMLFDAPLISVIHTRLTVPIWKQAAPLFPQRISGFLRFRIVVVRAA